MDDVNRERPAPHVAERTNGFFMKMSHQVSPAAKAEHLNMVLVFSLLSLVSAAVYLPFISRFGYFNDDWYLMYAAGTRGPLVFKDIFSIDRPLRMLVMIPAYALFGGNPLYYNLSAFLARLIGGIALLWILRMLWLENRQTTLWMSLLFLLYPGFLSQPNAIDYLCHLTGLAMGMISIGLTVRAIIANAWPERLLFYGISILLGWFYLGQIEWYVGLEFFRFACVLLLTSRSSGSIWQRVIGFLRWALPVSLIPAVFLVWRLKFFSSERGATDLDMQLNDFWESPVIFISRILSVLWNDLLDVLVRAWGIPLRRLSYGMEDQAWIAGYGIAVLVLVMIWFFFRLTQYADKNVPGNRSTWRWEAILIGAGALVFGLLPVLIVGRTVDFKSFSRYTLIASVGAALVIPACMSLIFNNKIRNGLLGVLLVSASLTHYANGLTRARETEATRNFWWQVSWRIPQMGQGTTLLAHYPAVILEEDYFVWGPANLIYYPESMHPDYTQPGIYSVVMNDQTIGKIFTRERQEFSNRRSIRTYPNYRNILILTQPSPNSCVQVIDGLQPEFSTYEDERYKRVGTYSEVEHIDLNTPFHQPPQIPFGSEPDHGWCYYYEKVAFARQLGDWNSVLQLGGEALGMGLYPMDQIEWMPLIQGYAVTGDSTRLTDLADEITDQYVREQACQILLDTAEMTAGIRNRVQQLFCDP